MLSVLALFEEMDIQRSHKQVKVLSTGQGYDPSPVCISGSVCWPCWPCCREAGRQSDRAWPSFEIAEWR